MHPGSSPRLPAPRAGPPDLVGTSVPSRRPPLPTPASRASASSPRDSHPSWQPKAMEPQTAV